MVKQIGMGKDAFGRSVTLGDLVSVSQKIASAGVSRTLILGTVVGISPTGRFTIEDLDGTVIIDPYRKKPHWFEWQYATLIVHAEDVENYLQDIYEWEIKNVTGKV